MHKIGKELKSTDEGRTDPAGTPGETMVSARVAIPSGAAHSSGAPVVENLTGS
jgi:hypothetical protein